MTKEARISHTSLIAGMLVIAIFVAALGTMSVMTKFSASGLVEGTLSLTVSNVTTITLPTSTVAFGAMTIGEINDTTDDKPAPFVVQNDGSVRVNVTIAATALWTGNTTNATTYNFKCGDTSESACPASSPTSFAQLNTTATTVMTYLNFTNTNDTLQAEISVAVPLDEPAGLAQAKSSTVTFTASAAE